VDDQHLHVQMHNDVLWARLRIAHLGVAVRTHIAYIAYCPRSRAVFASNIAASLHDIIIHALGTTPPPTFLSRVCMRWCACMR
jgi:hypothetical protein